jgi:hypothetical protein
MATSGIKAAIESQQLQGLTKSDPISLPGFGPSTPGEGFDPQKYKVRYAKIDFDDLGSIAELEILETRAIRNEGVFVLSKDRFVFMDKCFILVSYLERDIQS